MMWQTRVTTISMTMTVPLKGRRPYIVKDDDPILTSWTCPPTNRAWKAAFSLCSAP
jgi:hypothetical protein